MTGPHGRAEPELPPARSALAVCAHPDDESFGLGAVLDRFVQRGTRMSVLCFTRGEASTLGVSDRALGERRHAELLAASAELGVGQVELLEHPDGGLGREPLDQLAAEVTTMVEEVDADLLVVFDEGGVTGHPDHCRATQAALSAAPGLPALAWTVPRGVADRLNTEFGTTFSGRPEDEIDLVVAVERARQHAAIACHASQSNDNPVLVRRLTLLGDAEWLRWLRRPQNHATAPAPGSDAPGRRSPAGCTALAEEWDRRYASTDRLFRTEPDETLVEVVSPLAPGRAIDLGAGEGRNGLWLAAQGWRVTAVDISRRGLERLEQQAHARRLAMATVVDDLVHHLTAVPAPAEPFDLVVLAYVHPDPAERAELLHAAASVVAPGGHLFVVGHHRFSGGAAGPFDPARLYTQEDLHEAARGLEVLRLEERLGSSDVAEPGADLVLWARRPGGSPRPA